ncbi:MAG TPA: metallophosphoesterase [Candidatus Omnitrophota bacterium]|nr:hypothetical protein [Candidatus Omnitrophota bacterium]HRK62299.1 metallophosphoesterase [Candidatus Omnitrophota bacterium]
MSKTIIFGDIHGCLDEWQDLIKKINPSPDDLLISVGDLICKGPKSFKTIEFARSLPNLKCVLGNHELHFLKAWKAGDLKSLSKDYQKRALKEFGDAFESSMKWVSTWPLYLDLPECLVVHGGIQPDISLEKQTAEIICNLRNLEDGTPWYEKYSGKKPAIYGHWARQGLCIKENSIGLDSGCVYGKELSAVIFPEKKIIQVKARETYQSVD